MTKILITGGNSRFAKVLKKKFFSKNIFYTNRKELDILDIHSIEKKIKKIKPKIFIHIAGLSRPMQVHDEEINKSIDLNIIGTCNVVKICKKYNVKLVYFSTNYVYPGIKGNYLESDPLLPINNYAWSKLGGECAVQMYKNSLILRLCITEKPFIHKYAFKDSLTSFMFVEDFVKNFKKIIHQKGILNVGGEKASIYQFAKKSGANVIPVSSKNNKSFPKDSSMNINKFKKLT
tara:strand:- start:434 stop:1132 length:699 start_codon:yes stop_codon:yes gene_type:complete